MSSNVSRSRLGGAVSWFDPRARQIGDWAFILNRITALGLTLYLFMHLTVLGQLAQGPQAYDAFIAVAKTRLFTLGEVVVVAGGTIHGLNGLRVALNSFGLAVPYQKQIFSVLMAIALLTILAFAMRMLAG
jgi:succinate dehydrogenase / fumarate reductase cytochrome b subunit